jgi:hypothetical protein
MLEYISPKSPAAAASRVGVPHGKWVHLLDRPVAFGVLILPRLLVLLGADRRELGFAERVVRLAVLTRRMWISRIRPRLGRRLRGLCPLPRLGLALTLRLWAPTLSEAPSPSLSAIHATGRQTSRAGRASSPVIVMFASEVLTYVIDTGRHLAAAYPLAIRTTRRVSGRLPNCQPDFAIAAGDPYVVHVDPILGRESITNTRRRQTAGRRGSMLTIPEAQATINRLLEYFPGRPQRPARP